MDKRSLLRLFIAALAVSTLAAWFQSVPGYMDAEYYYAGGQQLAAGRGFQEPFIWNYLGDPVGIPRPSHTYWMPLASIVAAGGMLLTGSLDFLSARLFFIFAAALLAPLTANLSYRLLGQRQKALIAGWLAVFPGFYIVYLSNTENFVLYMLFGALIFLILVGAEQTVFNHTRLLRFSFGLGLLAGLMHLSRADGLLWLLAALAAVFWGWMRFSGAQSGRLVRKKWLWLFATLGVALVGYGTFTAAWYARNLELFGSLFSPASGRMLWLTDYDQTYSYPAESLTLQSWLAVGMRHHLDDRLEALGMNLKNFLAVQGLVFLLPLMLAGVWRKRYLASTRFAVAMWLVTLVVMTVVFPYAGWRGGFIHSAAAFQPLLWAVAPEGLCGIISAAARRRGWQADRAVRFFSVGAVVLSGLMTAFLGFWLVVGDDLENPAWQRSYRQHLTVEKLLLDVGVTPDTILMVNNPPGFYVATGRSSVVIPNGDPNTVCQVAGRYRARYLVLEQNHVAGLAHLYNNPRDLPGIHYVGSRDGIHVFWIEPES